jgi:hypothetical protein
MGFKERGENRGRRKERKGWKEEKGKKWTKEREPEAGLGFPRGHEQTKDTEGLCPWLVPQGQLRGCL